MRHIYIYSDKHAPDIAGCKVPQVLHGRLIGGSYIFIGKWRRRIQLRIVRHQPGSYLAQRSAGRDKGITLMVGC